VHVCFAEVVLGVRQVSRTSSEATKFEVGHLAKACAQFTAFCGFESKHKSLHWLRRAEGNGRIALSVAVRSEENMKNVMYHYNGVEGEEELHEDAKIEKLKEGDIIERAGEYWRSSNCGAGKRASRSASRT
jgi:hypothetical protein